MIWLLILIVIAGYIVADREKIIMYFKMLWEKMK